jgi:glycosyltransferase involved in cell wall biosynthesis
MKKLLFFGPANSPHLVSWVLPFKDNFEVEILTFHSPIDLQSFQGIKITILSPKIPTKLDYFFQQKTVQRFLDTTKPDIIHAHYASSYGLIAAHLKTNALKVLTVWGSDINKARNNYIHRQFIDRALLKYDWVNVPSDDLKSTLLKIGISENKLLVFQYGTNLALCDSLKVDHKESDIITIFSSRLWSALYNVDKIVEAFKLAYKKKSQLRLIVCGGGSPDEEKILGDLIGTHPGITQVGYLKKEELVKRLWEADVYVSIPENDGLSLSLLEAIYCECYPVLSNIPPNREVLNYCDGLVVKDLDLDQLSSALLEASVKFRQTDYAKNREFINKRANYVKNMERIAEIYLSEKY